MGKRLAVAIGIAAALAIGGALVFGLLFDDEPVVPPVAATAPPPPPADASPDAAVELAVVVRELEGEVEQRGGDQPWRLLAVGDVLEQDASVRTGEGASALLAVGENEVALDENTTVQVPVIARAASRIELGAGRIEATVPGGDGGTFGVGVVGSDAVAETEEGAFAVIASGDGKATVAASRGRVRLSSAGKSVELAAGTASSVAPERPPTAPKAVPASLFLKVQRSRASIRTRKYTLRGTTTPGAVISVNGVRVRVEDDGSFAQVVALSEGANQVNIKSQDVLGRAEASVVDVEVDSTAPKVGGDVKWGAN